MRKTVLTLLVFLFLFGLLAGCGQNVDVGRDEAIRIALTDAGYAEADVTRLHVEADREDGVAVYEVQFAAGDMEYEYKIQASDGAVRSVDYERYPAGAMPQLPQSQPGAQTEAEPSEPLISLAEATELALERVPGATERDLKIELDLDDGVYRYEGDIVYQGMEYEFEIDAGSGVFLEWSEERR